MEKRSLLRKTEDLALTTVVGGRSDWTGVTSRLATYALVGLGCLSILADVRVKDKSQDNYVSVFSYAEVPEVVTDVLYGVDRGTSIEW